MADHPELEEFLRASADLTAAIEFARQYKGSSETERRDRPVASATVALARAAGDLTLKEMQMYLDAATRYREGAEIQARKDRRWQNVAIAFVVVTGLATIAQAIAALIPLFRRG